MTSPMQPIIARVGSRSLARAWEHTIIHRPLAQIRVLRPHAGCIISSHIHGKTRTAVSNGALRQRAPFHSSALRLLSSPPPLAPPPLFDYAIRKQFNEVLERARSHPGEASYRHPRRWTALHCCAEYLAPLDVVEAVYRANPSAATVEDWRGRTPAGVAVVEGVREFLERAAAGEVSAVVPDPVAEEGPGILGKTAAPGMDAQGMLSCVSALSERVRTLTKLCVELQSEVDSLRHEIKKHAK
eukprot:CAMPEP_0113583336 /NCGR_PEP_ID=MMETSP0015_2-20120614/32456_1 /TAXON_ID=2838 /ORGANISM="Odontella" /LENGTH=241 /DNA_ID=CAMNT_0000488193 /DNA_START=211 /DNA_END=936 /DNA_ORIENTATION=+ /assembly_acc=CAM_ASM_000160